jgi:tripeptide aminopeptidase
MTGNEVALADLMALLEIEGAPAHESKVSTFLVQTLLSIGVPPDSIMIDNAQAQSEYGGDTGNLIVRFNGRPGEARRLFSAHMDTVPYAVGAKAAIKGNRVVNTAVDRALGGDDRAGCAVLLQIARRLRKLKGDHPPITLVFFIQEEVGLVGSRGLDISCLGSPRPAYCFNMDGSVLKDVVSKVTGTERLNIDIEGFASHAGCCPEQGVSAGAVAAVALADLVRSGWHGAIDKPGGKGSANLGIINGGTGSNVVMPNLHILAEARSHQRHFRDTILNEWKSAFDRSAKEITDINGRHANVRFSPGPKYEAYAISDDDPLVRWALRTLADAGVKARPVINCGGMDANNIVALGIPTVTLGTGQADIHTINESIKLDKFYIACQVAVALATSVLN